MHEVVGIAGHLVGWVDRQRPAGQAEEQVRVRVVHVQDRGRVVDDLDRLDAGQERRSDALVLLVLDAGLDIGRLHRGPVGVLETGLELQGIREAVRG